MSLANSYGLYLFRWKARILVLEAIMMNEQQITLVCTLLDRIKELERKVDFLMRNTLHGSGMGECSCAIPPIELESYKQEPYK
jgi:hypothetical protein